MPQISRLAFFGTPDFAVPTLDALVRAGRAPLLVVAQPDRPAGRGGRVQQPPVARYALAESLLLAQPEKVRDPEFLARIEALDLDVGIVVAFGQIFPTRLLAAPRLGCINLHASLLPAYRGAAPIQAAIAAGETATGVTTMRMEQGLDTGPILLQDKIEIGADETAAELSPRLAAVGARLILQTLDRLEAGDLAVEPQDDTRASYAPRLAKDAGRIDWSLSARTLADRLRAFTPWPGLSAELAGTPVKILRARALASSASDPAPPGTVVALAEDGLHVACGAGGVLALAELQRPGRRPLSAVDFVNGERIAIGARFT
ncbi:MAG TPA: methionyl-tRNA formyltransferase [Thermoanaerobaculia bacterium]|jgi:methionyl-tRNA formyltransferase|nr:methionyl-tRNA formyltransferase [Thermoanaerobaculia bacterium]